MIHILCLSYLFLLVSPALASHQHTRRRSAHARLANDSLNTRATVTLPTGWSAHVASGNDGAACYVDAANARILGTYLGSAYGISSCLTACRGKGLNFAGLEYGSQCYCAASLPATINNAPSSSCSYKCPDSSDTCGGYWRMQLFKYTAPASPSLPSSPSTSTSYTWSLQGCVTDGSARALTGYSFKDSKMTVALCTSTCATKGFSLAGIEYGSECFCGQTLSNGLGNSVDLGQCSSSCPGGGAGGQCGGYWKLSLFKRIASEQSTSSPTTTTKTSTSSSTAAATPTPSSASWNYLYCATDANARALTGAQWTDKSMTVAKCLDFCKSKAFTLGGVEAGSECWCGNALQNGQGQKVSDDQCTSVCQGDSSKGKCGGDWKLSLYSLTGSSVSSSAGTTSSNTPASGASTAPSSTPTSSGSYQVTNAVPSSGNAKYIWAHHIVGNTYPYTYDTWMNDIKLASAAGIDGFALNLGPDSWQPSRVADAYNAAKNSGTGFKMMLSFDMAEFSCGGGENVQLFKSYLDKFIYHDAAAKVDGKSAVTTFSGADCSFGQGSTNAGWNAVFGQYASNIYWMPAFNNDVRSMGQYDLKSLVSWGSAWPSNGQDIETSRDQWFIQNLQQMGKKYIGTLSPLFFSHLSYKNYLWRGDNWLYSSRWEQLISMRSQIDQVEIVSWNDFGESTYIGPIVGDMPSDAKLYANPSFPHTDILSLNLFYATAWKTGKYPLITQDKVWIMARPHPAWANAWGSPYGAPDHRDYTSDNFYAQVHLIGASTVTLCAGSNCKSFSGSPGINRFAQPLSTGQGISVQVVRNGQTTVNLRPSFTFDGNPQRYNFNYLIKSS